MSALVLGVVAGRGRGTRPIPNYNLASTILPTISLKLKPQINPKRKMKPQLKNEITKSPVRLIVRRVLLLLASLLLAIACFTAQSSSTLPGLYLTNAVVLTNGYVQLEVRTPNTTNAFALLHSYDLRTWGYSMALNSGTNRYVIESPSPISTIANGTIFLRAAPLGQAFYNLTFEFNSFWNGPLVNGTPVMTWPQQMQNWEVSFDVGNCTNLPAATNVLFSGPSGSGLVNEPTEDAYSLDYSGYSLTFPSVLLPLTNPPSAGTWTVQYGTNDLAFAMPDPQITNCFVVMVPSFAVSNGQLSSVSWTYRNPNTGAIWGMVPDFVARINFEIYDANNNEIYDSSTLGHSVTNFVFSLPIAWTNDLVEFQYDDTLNNTYQFQYSSGNQYEVWGGSSLSGVNVYNPSASGLTFLGSATNTSTFFGAFNIYVVHIPPHNFVKVDTVQGSNGSYYNTYDTGNVTDLQNLGGPPDGLYALIGVTQYGFHSGGGFGIDATGAGLTWLKVFVVP